MDRKPWQDKGLRRSFDGDEGGERRRFGRFDRFDREERSDRREFGDRPRRDFGDRKPFGDRPRFDRFDRSDRSDRFDRSERRDFGDRPRRDFAVRVLTTRSLSAIALTDRVRISALVRDRAPVPTIRAALPNALNLPAMPWSRLIRTSPISLAAPKQSTRLCAS